MRKTLLRLILVLFVLGVASGGPLAGIAQNANNKVQEKSLVGYISDNHCGLKHVSGMGDDKSCTLKCVDRGGKFVLADRDHKRVYQLDKTGQDKAREFAGQKVKVTGRVSGRTIRVTSIEPVA
jgi:Protein of unknown function (DUF5818)